MKWTYRLSIGLLAAVLLVGCSSGPDSRGAAGKPQLPATGSDGLDLSKRATLRMMTSSQGNLPEDTAKVKAYIEEATKDDLNADLEVIAVRPEDLVKKFIAMVSSEDRFDGAKLPISDFKQLMNAPSLLLPLNTLIEQYGKHIRDLQIPDSYWQSVTAPDGRIYGIPGFVDGVFATWFVRKDFLDAQGLPMPTTLAEIEAVAERFQKLDDSPVIGFVDWTYLENAIAPSLGAPGHDMNYLDPADRRIKPYFVHPNYKKVLETEQRWIDKGWIRETPNEAQDTAAFSSGEMGLGVFPWWERRSEAELRGEVPGAIMEPIRLEAGVAHSRSASEAFVIPRNSQLAERMMKYVDWSLASKANWNLTALGIPGEQYTISGVHLHPIEGKFGKTYNFTYNPILSMPLMMENDNYTPEYYGFYEHRNEMKAVYPPDEGVGYDFEEVKYLKPDLDEMALTELNKFRTGERSVDDYDTFVAQWMTRGGDRIIDLLTKTYYKSKPG